MEILNPGEQDPDGDFVEEPGYLSYVYGMIISRRGSFSRPEEAFHKLTSLQYQVLGVINKIHNDKMNNEMNKHK